MRQKSAQKRAEAHKMMEKEEAETIARQEKADHRLKERLGEDDVLNNKLEDIGR